MTLREKQSTFAVLVADLILHAKAQGYQVTLGEALRSPQEAARLAKADVGIAKSLHVDKLAIDLNLFIGGVYQKTSEAYRPLGEYWELQSGSDYTCCWGGRFMGDNGKPRPDGNHFSISHGGRK